MGLDVYLEGEGIGERVYDKDAVDPEKSTEFPDHYFTKTYLRSSYNGSGFNSVVSAILDGRDLHWIFEPCFAGGDEYNLEPTKEQLQAARERAVQLRDDLAKVSGEAAGVTFVDANNMFSPTLHDGITSDELAIAAYKANTEGREPDKFFGGGGWSNSVGEFYPFSPLTVRGFIPGKGFGGAGVYVIFDTDLTFYQQGAAIVIEFIDRALGIESPRIIWSG